MIYAGKKYGKVRLWWAGVCTKLFPKGLKWFYTCRYPVSHEPRKDCRRLFWGTVTRNTHARGGKLGFCSKHKPIVKAGWARYAEAKSKNRAAWCAKLTYACCVNRFILSTDSRGTFYYVDTREWPEWKSLPESAKRETSATEKYMLPIAREKWANLCSWQWIGYETGSEELRWIGEHLSTPLRTPDLVEDLKKVNKMIDQERKNEMARALHPARPRISRERRPLKRCGLISSARRSSLAATRPSQASEHALPLGMDAIKEASSGREWDLLQLGNSRMQGKFTGQRELNPTKQMEVPVGTLPESSERRKAVRW